MARAYRIVLVTAAILLARSALGAALEVQLPPQTRPASAVAIPAKGTSELKGQVKEFTVRFDNLTPDAKYDVALTMADGTVWRGVDMSWYLAEKQPSAESLDEDDQKEIRTIFDAIQGFENKRHPLAMQGNHDHATVLAELIRDTEFHSAAGGEIIWRIELWYFKNQHGGWERVPQQNQVLYRERFKTEAEYGQFTRKFRWTPALGGIQLDKNETVRTIKLGNP